MFLFTFLLLVVFWCTAVLRSINMAIYSPNIPHPHSKPHSPTTSTNPAGKGIPQIFATSKTLATEIVESTPTTLIFKLRQEYTPKIIHTSKTVNSLVSLTLDPDPDAQDAVAEGEQGEKAVWKGKVREHKDMCEFFS